MICLDKVFLLLVLVPNCFEFLLQLQLGKDPLYSTVTCACRNYFLWVKLVCSYWKNMALNIHKSVEETSYCILAVTKKDPGALISLCFLCSFELCKFSPFTLSSTLFISFQANSGKDLSFSYGLIDWAFLTQIPLQDFAEMTSKYHRFEATCFSCPLMSFEFELECSVLSVRQSWPFPD